MAQRAPLASIFVISAALSLGACGDKPNPDASAVVVPPEPGFKPTGGTIPPSETRPDEATKSFIEQTAMSDLYQSQLNKAAQARSKSDAIKAFATATRDDFTGLSTELTPIATSAGILPPTALNEAYMAKLNELTDPDKDFDATFKAQQQQELDADLQRSKSYAENASNPTVQAFARKRAGKIEQRIKAFAQTGAK